MTVVHHADQRISTTPNGQMTTIASPTQGGAEHSMWRVEMPPGRPGPEHTMDGQQIWWVERGGGVLTVDGVTTTLARGDCVVLEPSTLRQLTADASEGLAAVVTGLPASRASMRDGTDRGVPPWIA